MTGAALLVLVALLAGAPTASAADAPPANPVAVDAHAILDRMASFLAGRPRLRFEIASSYDAVQADGRSIEVNETRRLSLQRPDRLRVDIERSNGTGSAVTILPTVISVDDAGAAVYAETAGYPSLDEALEYFTGTLKLRLPLALLLRSNLAGELGERVRDLAYVEKTKLGDTVCHHVAGRTDSVDFQVWIAADGDPLPRRIVLTYPNAEGTPSFRANLRDWDTSPRFWTSPFEVHHAKDAERVAFLPELEAAAPGATPATPNGASR